MQRLDLGLVAGTLSAMLWATLAPTLAFAGEADAQILAELNFARAHPQAYALELLAEPVTDWERATQRGSDLDGGAYAETVDFLMRQPALKPLRQEDGLAASALEQVAAQGPAGVTGHDSLNGERFDARLRRHIAPDTLVAENIAYGPRTAAEVVRALIIDRGVADRGHRTNIFHPEVTAAGVACGPHATFVAMCVIDFAGDSVRGRSAGSRQMASLPESAGSASGPHGFLQRLLRGL
jgi:uncharacterized protein YkwD